MARSDAIMDGVSASSGTTSLIPIQDMNKDVTPIPEKAAPAPDEESVGACAASFSPLDLSIDAPPIVRILADATTYRPPPPLTAHLPFHRTSKCTMEPVPSK